VLFRSLSVCAGLITAIFISVISLVKHQTLSEVQARSRLRWKKYIYLPILVLLLGAGLALIVKPHAVPLPAALPETDVREVFWHLRQADLFGQILLLLAGAFGIVVFFKTRTKK
jgi:NADH-quinone oxidoreductase subunit J